MHPNNFNTDRGLTLSQAWYPMTNMLKESSKTPMKNKGQTQQTLDSA